MAVVCKRKLFSNENIFLPCGHGELKPFNVKYISFVKPVKNRDIFLFKKGVNICKCQICNIEYTYNIKTLDLKKYWQGSF